jgi:hypothetical protein
MGWSIDSLMCGDKFLGYLFNSFHGPFDGSYCSQLQQQSVGAQINVPGKPYVSAKSADQILAMADENGFVSSEADSGSGQCVALVKAAIPALGATSKWCAGDALDSTVIAKLLPGTAIGYGFDPGTGAYPSAPTGNHVAIFVSAKGPMATILDQWQHKSKGTLQKAMTHETNIDATDWVVVTRKAVTS